MQNNRKLYVKVKLTNRFYIFTSNYKYGKTTNISDK